MDFVGAKVLFTIILVILIVFAGAVPPAFKQYLDTWYGRLVSASVVLAIARLGGWYIGVAAAAAVLVLMPTNMREGFICRADSGHGPSGDEGFRGGGGEGSSGRGSFSTGYDQTIRNFTDYGEEEDDGFTGRIEGFADNVGLVYNSERVEGFAGADKRQEIPKERRNRWFIEKVMNEKPKAIETDTVETQAGQ